ncbi:hypothetical protein BN2497_1867 [Janthinobacterium sp. CG23_2]|nr:hypothetical protein BN2497_1867 [Janthinobacterium sp. CG23_2]CUU27331.1 hypothetical protein BN3177_1867 [Janthinobacterium sp. CG23_2]
MGLNYTIALPRKYISCRCAMHWQRFYGRPEPRWWRRRLKKISG